MLIQVNSHIQVANYFSQIRRLLSMTETDRRGLQYLLWHIQREPAQGIHQIAKDISEQLIHYTTEEADSDEEEAYNKNMDFLSEILHDTTQILTSDSSHKRIELQRLYIDLARMTEKQPKHLNMMNMARKIILASCNNTRIEFEKHNHTQPLKMKRETKKCQKEWNT